MEQYTTEILILLILLVIGFGFYNSRKSGTQSSLLNDQDPFFNSFRLLVKEEVDKIKKEIGDDITNLKVSSESTKTANEERAKQILEEQQKLMSSLSSLTCAASSTNKLSEGTYTTEYGIDETCS